GVWWSEHSGRSPSATRKRSKHNGGSATMPPGFNALGQALMETGRRVGRPGIMPATESALRFHSLESPYSGSEGEMLKKRFPQSSQTRVVENVLPLLFSRVSGCTAARAPATTNCGARHP